MLRTTIIIIGISLPGLFGSGVRAADAPAEDESRAEAEEVEVLKITVGEPTTLSPEQTTPVLAASRTGTVAAFYRTFYRTSTDGGRTWSDEMDSPCGNPGPMSVGLREGGVVIMRGQTAPIDDSDPPQLRAQRIVFSDDFLKCEIVTSAVSMPEAALNKRWATFWPFLHKGKIVQLPDGDLLAALYGNFKGDAQYRTMMLRSTDSGQSWQLHATVAYDPNDPHPHLVGAYCGYCEPSTALLSDGQLLCMLRTQGAQFAGEYRPMYACWSKDLGKTWTKPVPTEPHLVNIFPTLAVLDNGVVACQYGRPGFHVAFSLDNGHTWQDRVTFSDLPIPFNHGMYDLVKVGPNRLLAVGNDAEGSRAWPLTVERVTVSPPRVAVTGRVLDEQGNPIADATVERSPNRYYLDAWLEDETKLDSWNATPLTIGVPELGYVSIRKEAGYPTVQTDAQGRFQFDAVKLGEYVLTVEADDYAPRHRHIKVEPEGATQEFRMKPGRKVCNRVLDDKDQPVPGACVVLNRWHVHTDRAGFFHWSVEDPLPEQVDIKLYRRYAGYGTSDTTVPFAQIERGPIVLRRNR